MHMRLIFKLFAIEYQHLAWNVVTFVMYQHLLNYGRSVDKEDTYVEQRTWHGASIGQPAE